MKFRIRQCRMAVFRQQSPISRTNRESASSHASAFSPPTHEWYSRKVNGFMRMVSPRPRRRSIADSQKSALSLFHGVWSSCHSRLNISAARARASCSLTFAPWMKKTFAFSARTANGSRTAANPKSIAALRKLSPRKKLKPRSNVERRVNLSC